MPDQLQPIVQRMIDAGESEENIATVIQHFKSQEPQPVDRGGMRHPLTSLVAPELEGVRGTVNDALATPHGTPIMARSRTGALYQSETGTGAVNAAKSATRGFAGSMIDQAEGATSPLGLVAYGLSKVPVAPVANAAASVLENVPAAKSLIPFANPAKNIIPFEKMAGRLRTIAQTSQDAGMGVTRGADMYEMNRFPRSTESTARVPMAHGEPAPITDAMRAQWAMDAERVPGGSLERLASKDAAAAPRVSLRERFPNGLPINAPEAAPIQPMASHAPTGAIRTTAQPSMMESAELRAKQILPDIPPADGRVPTGHGSQPDNLLDLPDAAAAQVAPPDMAAQEARFNRGSQRLGREQGMTRADAQAQTDSVQGTRAETSLVAPWESQQRMMAKMEALRKADPTGRTLVEYIDKAADPKTKAALVNWERQAAFAAGRQPFYALAGAAVAPSVRDMLLQQMRAGVTGRETAQ